MHHLSLKAIANKLTKKEISAVELIQYFLDRINTHDKTLNSFVTVCEEQALQQAHAVDQLRNKKKLPYYAGIPIAQKDIFCTQGIKTSCGSKMLDNFIPPYNATVIEKFNQAGFITIGKTNMDEFAMGSSNESSFYGAVKNPWNITKVPGGSSGGSSAAIAARLAPVATGTDTGGSIRQPAALCNLTGLKPTYGRVSRYGMIAFASSLDQGGPMAKTAEDAAIMLNIMAGHDAKDSTCANNAVPDYTANLENPIKGLKIGLPKEYFSAQLDSNVAKQIEQVIQTYKNAGAEFIEISLPSSELAISAYYIIAPAEASSNLSRYDGVRYGYRCEDPKDLTDMYERSRSEGFGSEVKRRIIVGTYALSAGYYDAYYIKAQKIRRVIRDEFLTALNKVDVILSPTTPNTAFNIGEKVNVPVSMYLSDIYTIAVNLAGLPAISAPAGFINGLPLGFQLIGKHFAESTLLNAVHQYQKLTDWHTQSPEQYA
ncbi:MAG: Asp-tRNA(Asn)/Glu-tRNA(Gln) amidotransferase GatCAB subunit A [Legionellales bacterium]|nr:Asp-tRNA(Asn)/Glu-tRNA(Gln) amidotransferase GatCAB subunit A [Legionellales bacterium]|tara:strand:+ start:314 stop:1768 length:1455 start_codon:yes stop_codon:yes gene_type:complete